ncbi:hypothetical protein HDV01_006905 [Terramyces sp. JEL0728]|nr:hypothetical protein HDV01_006905 [Terramyces sp. JEL0728]
MYDQTELLFLTFVWLEADSLVKASQVCKRWNSIFKRFEQMFWKQLCFRKCGLKQLLMHQTWKDLYRTQYAFLTMDYKFVSSSESFTIKDNLDTSVPQTSGAPLFVWPSEQMFWYKVAIDGNVICWIDITSFPILKINVGFIDNLPNDPEIVIRCERELEGHEHSIGLLLTNGQSRLLSFDNVSDIFIWNLETFEKVGYIRAATLLQEIVSMNVQGDRLVVGGENGRIVVYDINTCESIFTIQTKYEDFKALNVGIWNDLLVYGMGNGKFVSFDLKTKQEGIVLDISDVETDFDPEEPPRQLIEDDEISEFAEVHTVESNSLPTDVPGITPEFLAQVQNVNNAGFVPRTLALNGHILITNAKSSNKIVLWDINNGKYIADLSEHKSAEQYSLSIPPSQELTLAELSRDGTLIYSTVQEEDFFSRLLVWDFKSGKREVGCFKIYLECLASEYKIETWLAVANT